MIFFFLACRVVTSAGRAWRRRFKSAKNAHCPVAQHKVEGPATAIEYLGIIIDTERGGLRLPERKLLRIRDLID